MTRNPDCVRPMGMVIDPITANVEDSNRAMGYEKPWNDETDWDGTNSLE